MSKLPNIHKPIGRQNIAPDSWFAIKKMMRERLNDTDGRDIADYFGEKAGLAYDPLANLDIQG